MMAKRYRPGTGGWPNASPGLPSPGPWHESQKDLANGNPPSFIAESGRSAEFCPAHLRAKHFGSQYRRAVLQCPALEESNRRPEVCATMPHSLWPMHGASYWGEARSTHTPARTDSLSDRELAEQRLGTP